jgi:DNA repair exonuclease SbcCD nuclease subunit
MNILMFGDIHIIEKDLEEIELIFDEINTIKNNNKIDKIIITGDTFDRPNPTSKELDCFSNFIQKINIPIILLVAKSHESISSEESILNHFGILKDNIKIVTEYNEPHYLYVGHFTLKESKMNYGAVRSKKDFKGRYRYVVLGHQHSFEVIPSNICQIGSIRYVDFAESEDEVKKVLIIQNSKEETEKCLFLSLSTPYPMVDAYLGKNVAKTSGKEAKTTYFEAISDLKSYLDTLNPKTKVRIVFETFEGYSQFLNDYATYKNKFVLFKDRKDFIISLLVPNSPKKETKSLKENLENYLNSNNINEEIKQILLGELK